MRAPFSNFSSPAGDAATIVRYSLDESTTPLRNTGRVLGGNLVNASGTPIYNAAGKYGGAASFDGASLIRSADTPVAAPTGKLLTFSAWVYMSSYTLNAFMVCKQARGAGAAWAVPYIAWAIGQVSLGQWYFAMAIGGAYYQSINFGVAQIALLLQLNHWNLVVVTVDGTGGTVSVVPYMNGFAGTADNLGVAPGGNIDYTADGPYSIGGVTAGPSNPTAFFAGQVDEVRAENVVRSAGYVTRMYASGVPYAGG